MHLKLTHNFCLFHCLFFYDESDTDLLTCHSTPDSTKPLCVQDSRIAESTLSSFILFVLFQFSMVAVLTVVPKNVTCILGGR